MCGEYYLPLTDCRIRDCGMSYPFDAEKATQVAGAFTKLEGGTINVMKLVKLVYLLDRLSIDKYGIPIVGGPYYLLPHGPVVSCLLDLINKGDALGIRSSWSRYLSKRTDYSINLKRESPSSMLSEVEKQLLQQIYGRYGKMDQFALRDWCHKHLPESPEIKKGRKRISEIFVFERLGKQPAEIQYLIDVQRESTFLQGLTV